MKITTILFACAVVTVAGNRAMPSGGHATAHEEQRSGGSDILDQILNDVDAVADSSCKCKSWCTRNRRESWCADRGMGHTNCKLTATNKAICTAAASKSSCGCCELCATESPTRTPTSPPKCADLPVPVDRLPSSVIPSLATNWKLQLPCADATCSSNDVHLVKGTPSKWKVDGTNVNWEDLTPDMVADHPHPLGTIGTKHQIKSIKLGQDLARYSLESRCFSAKGRKYRTAAFYAAKDEKGEDMVVMYVPTFGVTTSGSISPRVELRQEFPSKGWSLSGRHTLSVTARVMHVPAAKKSVAVIQLFNSGPFVEVMTRICKNSANDLMADDQTRCEEGELYMMLFMTQYKKVGSKKPNLYRYLAKYALGTKFDLKADVHSNVLTFTYTPEGSEPIVYTAPCDTASCYKSGPEGTHPNGIHFKAGAYLQKIGDDLAKDENGKSVKEAHYGEPYDMPYESDDDYALVYQYKAKITH